MDNTPVAIAALALTGTIATGFFALISKQNKTHEKLSNSIDDNTKMVGKLVLKTESNTKLVSETAKYLKHRNGTFEKLIQDAPALHELAKRANNQ